MTASTPRFSRMRGFSLVELMVSVVIGMLALMFATRLMTNAEKDKQAALGGSDSMQNGMLAMFSISGDAAQAGYGLNDPILTGCNTIMVDSEGYQLATAMRDTTVVRPLAAAVIVPGGANPDSITLYAGSSMAGTATLRLTADYDGGTRMNIDRRPYGFAQGDVIVVAPENEGGGDCAMSQISSNPAGLAPPPDEQYVMIAGGGDFRFNRGALGASFKGDMTRVFNLGPANKLSFHTWEVQNGFLRLRSTDLAATGAPVADNIVSIKAQYGFDTRAADAFTPQAGLQIGRWSSAMIDADGDTVSGGAGDYQRIAALRIAVVARSKMPERGNPTTGACTATTVRPIVFGAAEASGVASVPISVNVAVAGDPVDWTCYRYRVFETIVPLRNALWRPM